MEENYKLFQACSKDADCPSFPRCNGLNLPGFCIGQFYTVPGKCRTTGFGVCAECLVNQDCGGLDRVCDNTGVEFKIKFIMFQYCSDNLCRRCPFGHITCSNHPFGTPPAMREDSICCSYNVEMDVRNNTVYVIFIFFCAG